MLNSWRFSDTAVDCAPDILKGKSPMEFLLAKYDKGYIFGLSNLMSGGSYRVLGWSYDFTPYMKKILVKQYGQWSELYAPNKTALRKVLYGRIEKMVYL